jgi:DNA replication licensing factor MCM7
MHIYDKYKKIIKNFLFKFSENKKSEKFSENIEIKKKYLKRIRNLMNKGKGILEFEIIDIIKNYFSNEIKWLFFSNTNRFIKILTEGIDQVLQENLPFATFKSDSFEFSHKNLTNKNFEKFILNQKKNLLCPKYQIILKPPLNDYNEIFQTIEANFIGKFVVYQGVTVDIKPLKIFTKKIVFVCNDCNLKIIQKENPQNFNLFLRCPGEKCKNKKFNKSFSLDSTLTDFEEYQEIKIKIIPENGFFEIDSPVIKIKLKGILTKSIDFGDWIKIAGVLLPDYSLEQKYSNLIGNFAVEAFYVKKNLCPFYFLKKKKTENFEKEIIEICKDPNIYKKVSKSIAPSVYGNIDLKKAILLSILGSFSHKDISDSFDFYGQINICILGEPRTSKTNLLKNVSEIAPYSIFKHAINYLNYKIDYSITTKKKNQIDKISKLDNNYLFGQKILFIDNIDILREKKENFLKKLIFDNSRLNFSEKDELSKSYVTIISSATINENFLNQSISLEEQENFFEFFSNFDLKFLISKKNKKNFEDKFAKFIIHLFNDKVETFLNAHIIKKQILRPFIIESQKIGPILSKEIIDFIIINYLMWGINFQKNSKKNFKIQKILLIIRISTSLAKLKFQRIVNQSDILEAIRLINSSKKTFSKKSNGLKKNNSKNKNKIEKIYILIKNLSIGYKSFILELASLEKFILRKGFSREEFVECLGHFEELKIWSISIKNGRLIFLN